MVYVIGMQTRLIEQPAQSAFPGRKNWSKLNHRQACERPLPRFHPNISPLKLKKDLTDLAALEAVLFEARSGRDAARSKKDITMSRLEEKEDANLDIATNIRRLKDDIQLSQVGNNTND